MSMNEELKRIQQREFIYNEVLTTPEAMEFLGISRSRLSVLVRQGKIKPAKKLGCVSLFLKAELAEKKEELIRLRKKYRPFDYD